MEVIFIAILYLILVICFFITYRIGVTLKKEKEILIAKTEVTQEDIIELRTKIGSLEEKITFLFEHQAEPEENDISKEELETLDVTDEFRIPIVPGIKLQFDDSKETVPVQIHKRKKV